MADPASTSNNVPEFVPEELRVPRQKRRKGERNSPIVPPAEQAPGRWPPMRRRRGRPIRQHVRRDQIRKSDEGHRLNLQEDAV